MTLHDWLNLNGVSCSEFARKSGINQRQDVWKYARGRSIPSAVNMALIFRATSGAVTPNDFYGLGTDAAATPHEVAE